MRLGRISLFFILCLGGCVTPSYIHLRQPTYLITTPEFFSGCGDDPRGPAVCKEERIAEVRNGVDDWFRHFDEPTRPQVVIVSSDQDVPSNIGNRPIYLAIIKGFCLKGRAACYFFFTSFDPRPAMIFDSSDEIISSVVAHEFGHVLGRSIFHNDMPKDTESIMSYSFGSLEVLPIDIKILCKIHRECPPHEKDW